MATKVPCIKTVGALKKALAAIPDDTPLAIDDHGEGWGLKPPYLATHSWATMDHSGYYKPKELTKRKLHQAVPLQLSRPVCVIQPGTEHF